MHKVLTVLSLIIVGGCSSSGKATTTDTAKVATMSKPAASAEISERAADSIQAAGVPLAVASVGNHGEDLYDEVKASSWTKAGAIMDSLDKAATALTPGERTQLTVVLDTLRKSIMSHNREAAIETANKVTFIAAQLTEAYHPKMPADVVRLDYYGRELEIWAAQKNMPKLSATANDLRQTWERVKPNVLAHGGSAAAAKTDGLVAQLVTAKSPADYARVAKPFLDIVDELEKPFEK
jgi:hypothetical protein